MKWLLCIRPDSWVHTLIPAPSLGSIGILAAMVWSAGSVWAQTPVLNELMASNALAYFDDFFEADDWVEIYNPGGLLDLAGYHISDDPTNLTKYTFPSSDPGSTFMTPGDHVIIWLDKDSVQGVMHANFRLSAEDEGLWLTAPDGITVLDSVVYPPQQTDISYGRSCDGCSDWVYFNVPTPEATNAQTQVPTAQLFINEVLLENSFNLVDEFQEADAWLEIFNPNSFQVNLAGYTLQSDLGFSSTIPLDSPVETTIPADGFMLLWLDGQPEQGGHHTAALASGVNQTFALKGPDGIISDTYTAEVSFANISWGRVSDGSPNSMWFDTPTPGVSNSLLIIPPAGWVINEMMSQNLATVMDDAGEFDDWVEIHNPTNAPLDLAGYYVSDKLNNPTKWQVPSGVPDSTVIPAGGYVLLWADEQGSQGWNHMNFKLSSAGEVVVLRSPDGFSIADSLHFGLIDADVSLARLPNATGPFTATTETTPGVCNDCPTAIAATARGAYPAVLWPTIAYPNASLFVDAPGQLFNAAGQIQFTSDVRGMCTAPAGPGLYVYHAADGRRGVLVVSRN
jgi:hypothetical protein